MLLVNQVMTPLCGNTWPSYVCLAEIRCKVGRSPGDLCALSKAGLTQFETGPV